MAIMLRDDPTSYLAEFRAMLPIAPMRAVREVQLLIDHEIAIIAMARAELSGTGEPAAPLDAYLADLAGWIEGGLNAP